MQSESTPATDERAWFADRVREFVPELFGAAVRLCGDRTDAEDLVADAVARAWEALGSLRDRDAFRAWVFRILNNTFISNCRSAASRSWMEPLDTAGPEFSLFERLHAPILLWWGDPEQSFLNRLLRDDLERAVDGLPIAFRAVVVMVDVQGHAYREVADTLGIPIGTVRSRLARGRSLLQRSLWQHALEAGLVEGPAPETHKGGG